MAVHARRAIITTGEACHGASLLKRAGPHRQGGPACTTVEAVKDNDPFVIVALVLAVVLLAALVAIAVVFGHT